MNVPAEQKSEGGGIDAAGVYSRRLSRGTVGGSAGPGRH